MSSHRPFPSHTPKTADMIKKMNISSFSNAYPHANYKAARQWAETRNASTRGPMLAQANASYYQAIATSIDTLTKQHMAKQEAEWKAKQNAAEARRKAAETRRKAKEEVNLLGLNSTPAAQESNNLLRFPTANEELASIFLPSAVAAPPPHISTNVSLKNMYGMNIGSAPAPQPVHKSFANIVRATGKKVGGKRRKTRKN